MRVLKVLACLGFILAALDVEIGSLGGLQLMLWSFAAWVGSEI